MSVCAHGVSQEPKQSRVPVSRPAVAERGGKVTQERQKRLKVQTQESLQLNRKKAKKKILGASASTFTTFIITILHKEANK